MNLSRGQYRLYPVVLLTVLFSLQGWQSFAQADNCAAATTLPVITTPCGGSTTAGTTALKTQSMPGCSGTADDDVWYSFVATGGTLTINVVGGGGPGQLSDPVYEIFSGTCGSLTSVFCDNSATNNIEGGSISNLTNGNTYYIRVYSNANGTGMGTFTICLTKPTPPGNDNCTGATVLTPALTCVTGGGGSQAAGTLLNATNSGIAAGPCGGSPDDDVWFSFVAQNANQFINVTGIGSAIAVNGSGIGGSLLMQVYSSSTNNCAGVLTSIACGVVSGTDLASQFGGYVVGNTYFVRLYSANSISLSANANFNICVTNPPANDVCTGATIIVPQAGCVTGAGGSQVSGTLVNASSSGIAAGPCGGATDDDVWFRFVAQYTTQTATLSGIGSNIAVSGAGAGGPAVMQIFSSSTNNCAGVLTSIACGFVSGTNLVAYANGLTVGNTYFIRVYSTNNVALINNATFNLCVTNPSLVAPTMYVNKSFVNITKGLGGGTVETGDVLEIRGAIVVRSGMIDSCGFRDNIPAGTSYVPGSLAILTNEGKIYKSFTDAAGDDAGSITAGVIRINMGYNYYDNISTASRKGRIRNSHIPTLGSACIMLASYRVTVTAPLNSMINLGGGTFTYALITAPTTVITQNFNQNNVMVYTNTGLCSNSYGVNVLNTGLPGDFGGTFGSGNTINRVASPNMPGSYNYVTQTGGRPADFDYTISNNMSNSPAGYSTTDNWPKPEASAFRRIFGVWDVIGDHTNAANPLAGNPAADTTNGGTGGYMLLVNSAYFLDTVFKYPISGLCPNTYYELSFWVRNVCSRCGIDSMGRGASGVAVSPSYIPTAIGDSSGVYPNLSFSIDGVNHYTTGNIRYTGQWVKKGFIFRTGATQTNIVFAIANNAPGGGGNDWALDDISVATCTPNLNLVPNGNSQVCYGNQVDVNCDVISFFNNYVYYQWQVSHDNGVTWIDTLAMGTGSPTPSGGNYVYNAAFPSFVADSSQHGVQYRIRVATTPANLYNGCGFFNSLNIVVMVNNCEEALKTNLISFEAILKNKHAVLNWKTGNETDQTRYEIQKSLDGVSFHSIGILKAFNQINSTYTFIDPDELHSYAYYRVVVQEPAGRKNSRIKLLNVTDVPFEIITMVNPFKEKLTFELSLPASSIATIVLTDQQGKTIKVVKQQLLKGVNQVDIDNLGKLPGGTYILKVITDSGSKTKKLIKIAS